MEEKDLDNDGVVSINELNKFGFTSTHDYHINKTTKIATPKLNNEDTELLPFDYTKGTEKTFTADQSASDNSGDLSGDYVVFPGFSVPTKTSIIGKDTVIYRVGNGMGGISQNQLTTLPGNNTRIRTAQGFDPMSGMTSYSSYYRETKFKDDLDENGNIIKSAKQKFLEKFYEFRNLNNVPEENKTKNVEDFFTTGLE